MKYIDMHCDTLAEALARRKDTVEHLAGTMVDAARLRRSGAAAQFFAMFLPQRTEPEWFGQEKMPALSELLHMMYEIYRNTMEACSDYMAPARSYEDLLENQRAGKISAFLTIENGSVADGKLEKIKEYYDMGVRLMTLTWNDANCFGWPHAANPEEMRRGLTDFGKEAVGYMNELGMLVDVSHLSDGGFYDVADVSKKPFVASHSNCRALSPSTRNLTDEMIRVLAESGGVAGINFAPHFLNADTEDEVSRIARMCDHVLHLIDKGGIGCVGIGTDFDGIRGELEIADCTQMERLFAALHKRGLSEGQLEQIAQGNVMRVLCDVL